MSELILTKQAAPSNPSAGKVAFYMDTSGTLTSRSETGAELKFPTVDGTAASAAAAKTSETNAAASETNALASKNAAATSATNAATSETNALASKNAAATSATNAATSETNAAGSASSALASKNAASASEVSFKRQYQGALAVAPTQRYDATALQSGDLYFDTTNNPQPSMKVYNGTAWINAGSTVNGTVKRQSYIATAAQTSFTVTGGYDAGYADVYLNGVRQKAGTDVTVTSGTAVVFAQALLAGDEVEVVAFGAFSVADTYNQATLDAKITAATGLQQFRNKLMNGNLRVNQRGFATTTMAAGSNYYGPDRWVASSNQGAVFGYASDGSVSLTSPYHLYFQAPSIKTAFAAADTNYFFQGVEGFNVADLKWGTAAAKSLTVSFRAVLNESGPLTFCVAIRNADATRSCVKTFTVTNITQNLSVTFPGCTDGVWQTGTSAGLFVSWAFMGGTQYQCSQAQEGTWLTGNYVASTSAANLFAAANRALSIGDFQAEAGSLATAYEVRPYGVELAMCQRYYWKTVNQGQGLAISPSTAGGGVSFPVPMRVAPSITNATLTGGNVGTVAATIFSINETSLTAYNGNSNWSTGFGVTVAFVASAEL